MTTSGEQVALVTREDAPLRSLAAQINEAHEKAYGCVREGIKYARQAGEALIAAKRQVPHGEFGDWLQAHCTVTPRTAQKYMQLARALPGLIEKAPRVADLSVREALDLVASNSSRVARLDEDQRKKVLQAVEDGSRVNVAVRAVTRESGGGVRLPPESLTPPDPTGRSIKVLRNKEKRGWCVMVGPNDAGVRLPTLREEVRTRPEFTQRRADAEVLLSEADALEQRAQELRDEAKRLKQDLADNVRATLTDEHGAINPMTETADYYVDESTDAHLTTLSAAGVADYLLEQRGKPGIQEKHRGYYGDVKDMDFVDVIPPLDGGWTGVGSAAQLSGWGQQ